MLTVGVTGTIPVAGGIERSRQHVDCLSQAASVPETLESAAAGP